MNNTLAKLANPLDDYCHGYFILHMKIQKFTVNKYYTLPLKLHMTHLFIYYLYCNKTYLFLLVVFFFF